MKVTSLWSIMAWLDAPMDTREDGAMRCFGCDCMCCIFDGTARNKTLNKDARVAGYWNQQDRPGSSRTGNRALLWTGTHTLRSVVADQVQVESRQSAQR